MVVDVTGLTPWTNIIGPMLSERLERWLKYKEYSDEFAGSSGKLMNVTAVLRDCSLIIPLTLMGIEYNCFHY
jgi:hypothetical protein